MISSFFYLGLAVFYDYNRNKLVKTNEHHDVQALVGQYQVADANTIEQERRIALMNRKDIPIQAAGVSKSFKSTTGQNFMALNKVSINLFKGETLGLLGPNGAGKSTMFNILSTFHNVTEGKIKVFGKDLQVNSDFFDRAGICAQDEIVWDTLTVNTHLTIIRIMKDIPYQ